MPDFVGTYRLSNSLPEKWRIELGALAESSGLDIRSAIQQGDKQLSITVRAPKGTHGPTNELVDSFFSDVVQVVSGGPGNTHRAQLIDINPVDTLTAAMSRRSVYVTAGVAGVITGASVAIYAHITGGLLTAIFSQPLFTMFFGLLAGIAFTLTTHIYRRLANGDVVADIEKRVQAVHEQVLVREVSTTEDPKTQARLELARVRLRGRASNMRGDADRLWRRSLWAYRGAFAFFCLAIAIGPGVAAYLLIANAQPDWRFMFGGLSLAAVPLAIGTALLRHDTRLREQYQEAARDIASLERYELALDYSQLTSSETYQSTIQQVISQLLLSRATSHIQNIHPTKDGGEDAESLSGAKKIIDRAVDRAADVIETLAPRKNS